MTQNIFQYDNMNIRDLLETEYYDPSMKGAEIDYAPRSN